MKYLAVFLCLFAIPTWAEDIAWSIDRDVEPDPIVAARAGTLSTPATWHEQRDRALLNRFLDMARVPGSDFLCAVGEGQYGPTPNVVGPGPLIGRSWDRGVSWTFTQPPVATASLPGSPVTLISVTFPTLLQGWAVGAIGNNQIAAIYHTGDGGATWQLKYNTGANAVAKSFLDVCFVDSLHGWAVGAIDPSSNVAITATTDGGLTWHTQASGVNAAVSCIYMLDANVGYALANLNYTLKTVDGGLNWTVAGRNSPLANSFDLYFRDPLVGFLVAGNDIRRTDDGGATWATVLGPDVGQGFYALSFADSLNGFACADAGGTAETSDGGLTWQHTSFAYKSLRGCVALDGANAVVVGYNGVVARTADAGAWWEEVDGPAYVSGAFLADLDFVDENRGWLVGQSGTMRTIDGGQHWTSNHLDPIGGPNGVDFTDANHGWIASGGAWLSTDGGDHWTQKISLTSALDVCALDDGHAWVTTAFGTIARTTDDGVTWDLPETGTTQGLYGITFPNARQGWAVGWEGTILHSSDGGQTWTPQSSGTTSPIYAVSFPDTVHGWAASIDALLYTEDGGETWAPQFSSSINLSGVSFADTLHGCACGGFAGRSFITCTSDGGLNWTESAIPNPQQKAMKIKLASPHVGYSVGLDGRVLKSIDLEVPPTAVFDPAPSVRLAIVGLEPNPTRGAMRLSIRLASDGEATVELYDVNGRRVVSRSLARGASRDRMVNLDPDVRPGIYFVRVQQDGLAAIRKVTILG